jgi:repressor LexA
MRADLHVPASEREQRILKFLDSRERYERLMPSVREIGDAVGLKSSSSTHQALQALHRRGLIEWTPNVSRSVRLRRGGGPCPLCGGTGRSPAGGSAEGAVHSA